MLVLVADDYMRFVAVNQTACEALGYDREELLEMRMTDIARDPEAEGEYAEMVAIGSRTGASVLVRKDGSTFTMRYRAAKTTVAQMTFYVSIGWVED